ncbi:tetratricopeptide repeat protein [Nocardia sp. NPDC055321]
MVVRLRLGNFAETPDDPLGREYVGWFPRMTEQEAWESGRGIYKLGHDRIDRERFAFVTGGGNVCAIAEITGRDEHVGGRAALRGQLLGAGHPLYDAWIGRPDPVANASRNPVAYQRVSEEEQFLSHECYCGCGELATGGDFLPGHDVRAMQDRVRLLFEGSPRRFLDWVDHTLAESGDPDTLAQLGQLYLQRRNEEQTGSRPESERLAAQGEDADAKLDIPARLAEAERWLRLAADTGRSTAMTLLAILLKNRGELADAEALLRRAADAGDTVATVHLGILLLKRGDDGEAEHWLRRAADSGDARAMVALSTVLMIRGVHREAEQWLRRAADTGKPGAMSALGEDLLIRGEHREAEHWLRRAAARGDTRAMLHLGILLNERHGTREAESSLRHNHIQCEQRTRARLVDEWWTHKFDTRAKAESAFAGMFLIQNKQDLRRAADALLQAADDPSRDPFGNGIALVMMRTDR